MTETNAVTVVETFDPARYPLSDLKTAAELAFADFEALAGEINASAETAADASKKAENSFGADSELKQLVATKSEGIFDTLTSLFHDYPGASVLFVQVAKEILTMSKEWAEMDISSRAQELRTESTVDETQVETAEQIREHLHRLYEMCKMFGIVPDVNLKTRKVKGGNEATYPETSRLNVSDRTNVGRGARRSTYRWFVDTVEAEGTPQQIILRDVRGSWREFLDLLKSKEIKFAGESFEVEYNGHLIQAVGAADQK